MNSSLTIIGGVAGGLGIFLLAVSLITDGLKLAAGDALSEMLGRWTKTPGRGIASGIAITGIVQSSSAVTVATIGFVNAGILTMVQALGVVYGANVGTTMTGWLVAAVGFKFKIELFALPIIGLGMLLRLTGAKKRRGAIGMALVGFGLFFIGIDVLKNAFESIAASTQLDQLFSDNLVGLVLYIGFGFLMTLLTQSSSAAIAIILTAATGGVVTLSAAAAMVIGANVGTTSTAALAVIGATPNAKRVAAAHIIFNLATGIVALLLLPIMLWLVHATGKMLGLEGVPAVSLALFHTVFNILGVLLMWPLTTRLATFLAARFRTAEEIEGNPRYLDKTVLVSPALALNALYLELAHLGEIVRKMVKEAISAESDITDKQETEQRAVQNLVLEIERFVSSLGRNPLPEDIAAVLPSVLRATQYLTATADLSLEIAIYQNRIHALGDTELMEALARLKSDLVALVEASDILDSRFTLTDCEDRFAGFEKEYQALKEALLTAGVQHHIKVRAMTLTAEQLSRMSHLAEQLVKSVRMAARIKETVTFSDGQPKDVTNISTLAVRNNLDQL